MGNNSNFVIDEYVNDVAKSYERYNNSVRIASDRDISKQFKEQVRGMFDQVFDTHTDVDQFIWYQYTPGFADGDVPKFTVSDIHFWPNAEWEEFCKEENVKMTDRSLVKYGQDGDYLSRSEIPSPLAEMFFNRALFPVMSQVFGHNVSCIVKRNQREIIIDEYECGY